MDRWPSKPPRGQRCDAYTGPWDVSATRTSPVRVGGRCPNGAVETVFGKSGIKIPMWLCADCVEKMWANGDIVRNPRKYPGSPPE